MSLSASILGVSITFLVLAAVTVALRIYTRVKLIRNTGPEDWVIVLSLLVAVVLVAFSVLVDPSNAGALPPGDAPPGVGPPGNGPPGNAPPGSGPPRNSPPGSLLEMPSASGPPGGPPGGPPPFELLKAQLAAFWTIPVYYITLFLTKLSILLQYLRIFSSKRMRIAIYAAGTFTMITSLFAIISTVLICSPLSFSKEYEDPADGKCLDRVAIQVNGAMGVATDILVTVLPMPGISRLQLPRSQKIAVILIFSLAGFGCLVSIMRFGYIMSFRRQATSRDAKAIAIVVIWSAVEVTIAIMCTCLPTLRPLLARLFPSFVFSSEYSERMKRRYSRGGSDGRGISFGKSTKPSEEVELSKAAAASVRSHVDDVESLNRDPDVKISAIPSQYL